MTRAVMHLVLPVVLFVVAFDGAGSTGPRSLSRAPERSAAVVAVPSASEIPPSATTGRSS